MLAVPGVDNRKGGRLVRYSVEVEGGLDGDGPPFAAAVAQALRGASGWERADTVRFVSVPPGRDKDTSGVDLRVTLASPGTVDKLCYPLQTKGEVSCYSNGRAVINHLRWQTGAPSYGSDLANYRIYLINHEVGHALGHGHVDCPKNGQPAPIMLQQTLGLQGCTPWPYPVPPK